MPPSSSSSSYALNSSKRKFYKLLDNISTPKVNHARAESITSLAHEPPNKRSRAPQTAQLSRPLTAPSANSRPFSAHSDRPITRAEPISAVTSPNGKQRPRGPGIGSRHIAASSLGHLDGAVERGLLNYAPWSHEQFLTRLKTFADFKTWTTKPVGIGEVEWAKRGWTVNAKDTVCCKGGCEKRLLIKIVKETSEAEHGQVDEESSWWMGDVEKAMVERYKDLIITAHDEECLWRKAGCKVDIYRIQMADPAVWQKELKDRYASLLTIESALPDSLEMPQQEGKDSFDIDAIAKIVPPTVLERSPKGKEDTGPSTTLETATPTTNDANRIALNLALCGWTGQSPNGVHLAYCTKCFQRVGLWLYRIAPSTTPLSSDLEPMTFNPIELHREHCPWKNPESQCAKGSLEGLAGWQVLVSLVKGHRRHDSVDREGERDGDVASVYDEDSPRKSRDEIRKEDLVRKGRLQRLKRAFTVSKKSKDKT